MTDTPTPPDAKSGSLYQTVDYVAEEWLHVCDVEAQNIADRISGQIGAPGHPPDAVQVMEDAEYLMKCATIHAASQGELHTTTHEAALAAKDARIAELEGRIKAAMKVCGVVDDMCAEMLPVSARNASSEVQLALDPMPDLNRMQDMIEKDANKAKAIVHSLRVYLSMIPDCDFDHHLKNILSISEAEDGATKAWMELQEMD